ncbi:Holliday junction DNA helicase subunit RuvA [Nitrosomonas aestuarii]|uniref:Holliday junction branch migration complex subunit RuvA n=1 Tax=Nitrosomonas aestuarii TaxID=52441 RepID=A0A1I3X431_9PROT|nr:Holliday junction branch migration protein RuvA [Nitrosomonas aestuarii]SFK13586.1 Holliday junction DNA helicase subunit RuvA [Nitrosomonas aestuarii]
MIGRLTGILLEKQPPLVLLDVRGVGYEIDVPMSTFFDLPAVGEQTTLYIHLLVREDAHLLFGFATESERLAFRQLVKISGVGARTALALLSGMSVAELHQAVSSDDSTRIVKIPGIGKKTAERLLLELRDKLGVAGTQQIPAVATSDHTNDIINALLSLGYNAREANWAVKQISVETTVAEGIRQALQRLSKDK